LLCLRYRPSQPKVRSTIQRFGNTTNRLTLAGLSTQVSDAGLAHLKGLVNLSWLDLYGTHFTDGGLRQLTALTKLSVLNIAGTQLSDAGIYELKHALPKVNVVR
jgi:hypothetical protein